MNHHPEHRQYPIKPCMGSILWLHCTELVSCFDFLCPEDDQSCRYTDKVGYTVGELFIMGQIISLNVKDELKPPEKWVFSLSCFKPRSISKAFQPTLLPPEKKKPNRGLEEVTIWRPQKRKIFKTDTLVVGGWGAAKRKMCPLCYKNVRKSEFAAIISVLCSRWLNCNDDEGAARETRACVVYYFFSLWS